MLQILATSILNTDAIVKVSMMFVYLHGFNSTGQSAKGQFLKQHLAPDKVLTPTYQPDPHTAITCLSKLVSDLAEMNSDNKPLIIIGSSLGGYYAQYLAHRFRLATILINPALEPMKTLKPYLGWQTNYYTGEKYYFGNDALQQLDSYNIRFPCKQPVPTLVLLDEKDEVIDSNTAREIYADCADVVTFAGGNHRFEHLEESLPFIRNFCDARADKKP